MPPKSPSHPWQFKARFRRHAFGWRSQPAITRVREAVKEIKAVARKDPMLAAEGAVLFLEKVSPALEQVDSSSGAIGSTVNAAIDALVQILDVASAVTYTLEAAAAAGVEGETRERIRALVSSMTAGDAFVTKRIARKLGMLQ